MLVTLARDDEPRAVQVPEDLATAREAAAVASAFEKLSYTRRREIASGVTGGKKPDTRQRRIGAAIEELAGGKSA